MQTLRHTITVENRDNVPSLVVSGSGVTVTVSLDTVRDAIEEIYLNENAYRAIRPTTTWNGIWHTVKEDVVDREA